MQTAVDIHPRQSQSGARRSLLKPRLRAIPTRPARYTPRPASRLPQSCRHLQGLANVTSATPQRFELLLQFHRKNTRRLIQMRASLLVMSFAKESAPGMHQRRIVSFSSTYHCRGPEGPIQALASSYMETLLVGKLHPQP